MTSENYVGDKMKTEYITCGDSYDAERLYILLNNVRKGLYEITSVSYASDTTIRIDYKYKGELADLHAIESRRYGQPRTEEERLKRHFERYGTIELPPRGTGLQKSSSSQIPTCPICGKPMKKIIGKLYQCPDHPFQTATIE